MLSHCISPLFNEQGEVYIRGRKRAGLISDEEISGLRIGLVKFAFKLNITYLFWISNVMTILIILYPIQVFQSAALFDSMTVRENVGFLL